MYARARQDCTPRRAVYPARGRDHSWPTASPGCPPAARLVHDHAFSFLQRSTPVGARAGARRGRAMYVVPPTPCLDLQRAGTVPLYPRVHACFRARAQCSVAAAAIPC
ncbi:MAG: hypothetical protein EOO65_01130 [Methanosarcinales archaeon]|nr:MAG: hypothetical protein EOO65_01130 [Methanosarcinales archaeon]